jgi:predicted DNA-binding protein
MSKAVVSFKIDPKLKEVLQKLAAEDTRTLSNYLVTIIQDHLKAKGILWGAEEQHEENQKEESAIRFSSKNINPPPSDDH